MGPILLVNIRGNEAADTAAKEALTEEFPENLKTKFSDLRAGALSYIKGKWQAEWGRGRMWTTSSNEFNLTVLIPSLEAAATGRKKVSKLVYILVTPTPPIVID